MALFSVIQKNIECQNKIVEFNTSLEYPNFIYFYLKYFLLYNVSYVLYKFSQNDLTIVILGTRMAIVDSNFYSLGKIKTFI